jgi:hypothetical protein
LRLPVIANHFASFASGASKKGIHLTSVSYSKFAEQIRNSTKARTVLSFVQVGEKDAVMLFVLVGVAAGAYLTARSYTVFALFPVVVFCAAGATLNGIATRNDPRVIAIEVLGTIALPQIAFVVASLRTYLRATSPLRMLQSMQTAIGQELRTEFEVPRGLPPQMAVLVTKLQHA